jgi:hypothetical protein
MYECFQLGVSVPALLESRTVATPRRTGPCLAKRTYQAGSVYQKGKNKSAKWDGNVPAYGRFWKDVPEAKPKRITIPLGICRTRSIAERKCMDEINKLKLNSTPYLVQSTSNITFRQQAEVWLQDLQKRRNNPIEQTTIDTRRYALDKWLLPFLGNTHLAELNNPQLKALVDEMAGVLAPSTIRDYTQIVKAVVASAINDDGEEMFPRKWNAEFIDAPPIGKRKQPASDCAGVTDIVFYALGQYRMLYALLAGCGPLRAGEALGLEIGRHISPDFRTFYIRQKAKRGVVQPDLKTKNGEREVDLCSPLATMLREFVGDRKSGLLFQTSTGKQLLRANTLQDSLHPILNYMAHEYGGFNIFRRFHRTHLETAGCPEVLRHFWSGHKQTHFGERYIKLLEKRDWRLQWAERIGLGFELPEADLGRLGRLVEFRKVG